MSPSAAVTDAFRKSQRFVEALDAYHGPYEKPDVALLQDVAATLWDRKGKRLRPRFVLWFGEFFKVAPERLSVFAWAAEAIHTASLLHDDVIDCADRRRAGLSANAIFDNSLPVLSGDYLFSDAIQRVAVQGNREILERLCLTVKSLAEGECLQYSQRYRIPQFEHFFERVNKLKTSSLLLWAAQVGALLQGEYALAHIEAFVSRFGQLYQYSDDLLDVVGTETKPQWNDLREGKVNWVVWQLIKEQPALAELLEKDFLARRISDATLKAIKAAVSRGGLSPIYEKLEVLSRETRDRLQAFPEGETREALSGLTELCLSRVR